MLRVGVGQILTTALQHYFASQPHWENSATQCRDRTRRPHPYPLCLPPDQSDPALNLLLGPFSSQAGRAWLLFWFSLRQHQWDGGTGLKKWICMLNQAAEAAYSVQVSDWSGGRRGGSGRLIVSLTQCRCWLPRPRLRPLIAEGRPRHWVDLGLKFWQWWVF